MLQPRQPNRSARHPTGTREHSLKLIQLSEVVGLLRQRWELWSAPHGRRRHHLKAIHESAAVLPTHHRRDLVSLRPIVHAVLDLGGAELADVH